MQRTPRFALALALALAACDPGFLDPILTTNHTSDSGDTNSTMTSTGTSTGDPDPGTGGEATSGATSIGTGGDDGGNDDGGDDTASFVVPPDPPAGCDVWAQDCPAGQKCSAAGPPPLGTDDIECTPIVPAPAQVGEPCQVLDPGNFGPDTCDSGLQCWDVDPDTGVGTCAALCQGSEQNPTCDAGFTCLNIAIPVCVPSCDPLLQDCPAGQNCRDVYTGFACLDIAPLPGKGTFEPCEQVDQCAAGLVCVAPDAAAECDQDQLACCTPFCNLDAPNTCPGDGQVCVPLHGGVNPTPDYEHVGLCFVSP